MKWINAEAKIKMQIYDEEHEEYTTKEMTVEDALDAYTEDSCPTTVDIDSIIAEHEHIGYEKGLRDGYAEAVDAEPVKHGHWEFIGGYGYQYRCSNCVRCAEYKTDYCPSCGCKMDEVNNETN